MNEASDAILAELRRRGVCGAVARVVWTVKYNAVSGQPEIEAEVELKGEAAKERQ